MSQGKIEKYKLHDRVVELLDQNLTGGEIARILTEELDGKDTISQPTVHRYIKPLREEAKNTVQQVFTKHVQASAETDIEKMETVLAFEFEQHVNVENNTKLRSFHGLNVTKIIYDKYRMAIGDAGGDNKGIHPVDLSKYKTCNEDENGDD